MTQQQYFDTTSIIQYLRDLKHESGQLMNISTLILEIMCYVKYVAAQMSRLSRILLQVSNAMVSSNPDRSLRGNYVHVW